PGVGFRTAMARHATATTARRTVRPGARRPRRPARRPACRSPHSAARASNAAGAGTAASAARASCARQIDAARLEDEPGDPLGRGARVAMVVAGGLQAPPCAGRGSLTGLAGSGLRRPALVYGRPCPTMSPEAPMTATPLSVLAAPALSGRAYAGVGSRQT